MTNDEAQAVAQLVLKAKRAKESPEDIGRRLVNVGIPADKTAMVLESIDRGFKAGVDAALTGGASDAAVVLGENPLFDAGHRIGARGSKVLSRPWYRRPITITLVLIVAAACVAAYYLQRSAA